MFECGFPIYLRCHANSVGGLRSCMTELCLVVFRHANAPCYLGDDNNDNDDNDDNDDNNDNDNDNNGSKYTTWVAELGNLSQQELFFNRKRRSQNAKGRIKN